MRTSRRSPLARRLSALAVILAVGILAAGCVTFDGPTTASQTGPGDVGATLRYSIPLCTDSDDDKVCSPHVSSSFNARLVAGILVPIGSVAPPVVTTTLSEPVFVYRQGVGAMHSDLQAFRTMALSADFNSEQAPPSGSTWVAYISESMDIGNGVSLSGTSAIDVQLPLDADGNPPASASRQASITQYLDGPIPPFVTGTDPAPGQTDTLALDCWQDANADGTPEVAACIDEMDPATPASVSLRRLTLTGPSSATVTEAEGTETSVALRLEGPPLPNPTVEITVSITGTGLGAFAPVNIVANVNRPVSIPVTLTATKGAQPGTLTVIASTRNGTKRVAIVPVNVLSDDDGTRPSTTIQARSLTSGKIELSGQATDQNRSAGLTSVKVQAFHGIRNGRCEAWNGRKLVTEACAKSLARWITLPVTIAPATTSIDWRTATPRIAKPGGLWILRARAADGDGLVSRVGTARVKHTVVLP